MQMSWSVFSYLFHSKRIDDAEYCGRSDGSLFFLSFLVKNIKRTGLKNEKAQKL